MKKYRIELFIILVISAFAALLIPNFMNFNSTIKIPGACEFFILFIGVFILLSISYLAYKPVEKLARIPDGYQKLYNKYNQISKEGVFKGGRLIDGCLFKYRKDGSLRYTKVFKGGVCVSKDASLT